MQKDRCCSKYKLLYLGTGAGDSEKHQLFTAYPSWVTALFWWNTFITISVNLCGGVGHYNVTTPPCGRTAVEPRRSCRLRVTSHCSLWIICPSFSCPLLTFQISDSTRDLFSQVVWWPLYVQMHHWGQTEIWCHKSYTTDMVVSEVWWATTVHLQSPPSPSSRSLTHCQGSCLALSRCLPTVCSLPICWHTLCYYSSLHVFCIFSHMK